MSIAISVEREISDLAAEETEAGIDIGRENIEELVDDAAAAHPQCSGDLFGRRKEPGAVFRPGLFAGGIAGGLGPKLPAACEFGGERIGWHDGGEHVEGFRDVVARA